MMRDSGIVELVSGNEERKILSFSQHKLPTFSLTLSSTNPTIFHWFTKNEGIWNLCKALSKMYVPDRMDYEIEGTFWLGWTWKTISNVILQNTGKQTTSKFTSMVGNQLN